MPGIKVGIVGFGYMGHFHLDKIRLVEGVDVAAVYDTDPKALAAADQEGIKTYSTRTSFFEDQGIDVVVIATPNHVHGPLALEALEAGKHVLLEKPATMNAKEFCEVMECAENHGKLITVHQNRRWDKDFRMVKEIYEKGTIGNMVTIESRVLGERGICFGWRANPEAGGGMLYDWSVHLMDQMCCLFRGQKVKRIYANLRSILTPKVDDFDELELTFESGTCARIVISTFALQKLPRWFVYGDRGALRIDDFSGESGGISRIRTDVEGYNKSEMTGGAGPTRTMAPLNREMIECMEMPVVKEMPLAFHENLKNAVLGKTDLEVKPQEVLRVMRLIDAAFESSKTGERIEVNI